MHDAPAPGHNARRPAQWQTPHRAAGAGEPQADAEPDLDLVEESFREGFGAASDPVSFLRLAGIPLMLRLADGRYAHLLRVEEEEHTDVGAVSAKLGGGHVVRPLPAHLVGRRRQLRFVYQADDEAPAVLSFAEARAAEAFDPA